MRHYRGWSLLAIAAMVGALAFVFALPASAHAAFKSSVPAPNAIELQAACGVFGGYMGRCLFRVRSSFLAV